MENEFVNIYIQGLVEEAVENTKARLINQAKLRFNEEATQKLITRIDELNVVITNLEESSTLKDTEVQSLNTIIQTAHSDYNILEEKIKLNQQESEKKLVELTNKINNNNSEFQIRESSYIAQLHEKTEVLSQALNTCKELERQVQVEIENTKKEVAYNSTMLEELNKLREENGELKAVLNAAHNAPFTTLKAKKVPKKTSNIDGETF